MKALNKRVSEEIRNIVLEAVREHPEHAFHVTSNLNWHRYEKQIEQVLFATRQNGFLANEDPAFHFRGELDNIRRETPRV